MFADEAGLRELDENPFDISRLRVPKVGEFVRSNVSSTKVETDTCCLMANYTFVEPCSPKDGTPSTTPRQRGMSMI
jgi:hypothetical protein